MAVGCQRDEEKQRTIFMGAGGRENTTKSPNVLQLRNTTHRDPEMAQCSVLPVPQVSIPITQQVFIGGVVFLAIGSL